ncbi:MAG: MFS transporter [Gemmatimonadota bacterium]|jgi:MFS family permease
MTDSSPHNARRLFIGSCIALIATSVAFATVGAIMLALKRDFVLTNEEVGWIGGAALWGFAVSQLIFAPLCDTLGMRFLLRLAWVGHLVGTLVMIFAPGFWALFGGALIIAMANGLVEAACNPLVASLYPDNKTVKLNQFHVWFPGGVVLGGLGAFALDAVGVGAWQLKLALILIPTLIYGVLLLTQPFPATEGVQAGVKVSESFKAAFGTPLMWVMLIAMAMTASVELGPNRWVPAVLEAGGMPGILVLVWINGLMAILRSRAGPVVEQLSPTGILLASAVLSGVGLLGLSIFGAGVMTFVAATVFAVGVCYFWPTMLGVVSERVPRSGALGLGLMGTVGMATVGLVTSPVMGSIADDYAHERLPPAETVAVLQSGAAALQGLETPDARLAADLAQNVVEGFLESGELASPETANALRAVIASGVGGEAVQGAQAILGPADNYGGRISFRYVVPLCGILTILFAVMYTRDRRAGGYRVTRIGAEA